MKVSKKTLMKWGAAALVVAAVGVIGFRWWRQRQTALPEGIASGNGRLEAKLVDVAAKEALRVDEIFVDEGEVVKPNQTVARLDTSTLDAELSEAHATVAAAEERLAFSNASIVKQRSEIELADIEVDRSKRLVAQGAGSQRELDTRHAKLKTTRATLAEAQAALEAATQQVEAARAKSVAVQTRIDDATLTSPVTGRVLYRLVEPGEVLGPGGRALTLVNLEDVYMEIFLPSEEAAATKLGSEARIVLDHEPTRAIPATVTFVSPEAQFTPKQVETKTEREKLMFRVKLQVPNELAGHYVDRIKTGVRGVGYVQVDPATPWPAHLQNVIAPPPRAQARLDGHGAQSAQAE